MAALLLAAVLLLQGAAGPSRPGVIAGRVSSVDGTPAARVRVAATPIDPANPAVLDNTLVGITETDAAGDYRLEGLPPGQYRVVAGLLEWLTYYPGVKDPPRATAIQITAGATKAGLNFTLQRPVSVAIRGRVTRLNPRAVLPKKITVSGSGMGTYQQFQADVAVDGSFEFLRVLPGTYQLQIEPYIATVTSRPITVFDKDIEGIEIAIPFITNVRGKIVIENGGPFPRANISFVGERGRMDSGMSVDGSFSIGVPEGEHRIVVSGLPGGYALDSISSGATDLLRQPLKVGETEIADVVIRFAAPPPEMFVKVKGRVVRPAENPGPPLNKISLSGQGMITLDAAIAADGSFEFPKVLPGVYSANVQPRNGTSPAININVIRDIDALEIAIPREFEISGRVVVEQDGPQPQLTIRAANLTGPPANTYAAGGTFKIILQEGEHRFTFDRLQAGYSLKSAKAGAVDLLAEPLKLAANSKAPDILLEIGVSNPPPWKKVSGRVVASTGRSLPSGLKVALEGGAYQGTDVKADGSFEFARVFPGSYTVAILSGHRTASAPLTVVDRDVSGFEIRMPRQVDVSGRIVIEGGAPQPGASMIFRKLPAAQENPGYVVVTPAGVFKTTIAEGDYKIEVGLVSEYTVKSITAGSTDLIKESFKAVEGGPSDILVTIAPPPSAVWRKVSGKALGDRPVAAGVQVLMTGRMPERRAAVNPDGTFEFDQVLPGTYTLGVIAGMAFSPATEILVDKDVTGLELKIPRPLTVTGVGTVDGGVTLSNLPAVSLNIMQVGGLGGLLIHGGETFSVPLAEGDYEVSVRSLAFGYELKSLTYGATNLLKDPLKITDPVSEPIRIVLAVQPESKATGVKISGRAPGSFSTADPQRVLLASTETPEPSVPQNATALKADGTFQFERVPPGKYTARLVTMDDSEAVPIVVGTTNVTGIELASKGQVEVSGLVTFEGEGQPPDFQSVDVIARKMRRPQGNTPAFSFGAPVNADGTFKLMVPFGDNAISVSGPAGYTVKSFSQGSTDLTKGPLRNDATFAAGTPAPIRIVLQPAPR